MTTAGKTPVSLGGGQRGMVRNTAARDGAAADRCAIPDVITL
jgi:hypothetical protein